MENLQEQHELLPHVNEAYLNEQDSLGNESSVEISFNSEDESLCNSLDETVPIDDGIRISSPLPLIVPSLFNPQLSSITQDETRFEDQQQHKASKEALFSGSSVTIDDAASLVEMFCCRFHLSDEGSSALHSLISNLLPSDNLLPSGFRHIQKIKRNFSDNVCHILTTEDYCVCVLKFRFQLRDVVQRNLNQIFNYSDYRRNHPNTDLSFNIAPLTTVQPNHLMNVNLNLFTDGVRIKKSTLKKAVWPVWIQITDLPPILRMTRKNTTLAALFVGKGVPDWEAVAPEIRAELLNPIELSVSIDTSLSLKFQVNLLIADLGAKSHLLNRFKFNGFFGCHFCTVKGTTIGKTHSYYPYCQEGLISEPFFNEVFVEFADCLSTLEVNIVVGVKGKSPFAPLIKNLPVTAPVDYMHCVLLGVFPETLRLCFKTLTHTAKSVISQIVSNLSCPREMIASSRKIRPLEELSQFKANEQFNWMIYLSPIILRERLPHFLYSHLTNLVFGVRLLLENSYASRVSLAEELLDNFCRDIVDVHGGNEKVETINVHSLRHLADQVRRFGPLFTFSAMSFEAANRTLGEVVSGSNSECQVICRRISQRHRLANVTIENTNLKLLSDHLTGKEVESSSFSEETAETPAVKRARTQYPKGVISNRQKINSVYFDSTSFKRSKFGNCYIFFLENGNEKFGEIQYFIRFSGAPFNNIVHANILIHATLEELGPVKGFLFKVCRTTTEDLIPIQNLTKVFRYTERNDTESDDSVSFMMKLCSTFEHS